MEKRWPRAGFELLHRPHQADVALLHQIQEVLVIGSELFGDGDHQPQIGQHKFVARSVVGRCQTANGGQAAAKLGVARPMRRWCSPPVASSGPAASSALRTGTGAAERHGSRAAAATQRPPGLLRCWSVDAGSRAVRASRRFLCNAVFMTRMPSSNRPKASRCAGKERPARRLQSRSAACARRPAVRTPTPSATPGR